MSTSQSHPVVVFDGVCNLCNGAIDFIVRHDREAVFRVTANQHGAGRQLLADHGMSPDEVDTIYLFEEGRMYQRSTAALRIARRLPFPWRLLYGFIIVPAPIRDAVYRVIARNRYRWFGKKETCRLPTPSETSRFLT